MVDNKYFEKFNGNVGITKEELLKLELPSKLPQDYLELLQTYNGGEGFIGDEYLILYKAEELKQMNKEYEVEKYTPDLFLIGSNGGGEAVAFDLRDIQPKIVLIPFIFEYKAIIELGSNIDEFFKRVFEIGYFK